MFSLKFPPQVRLSKTNPRICTNICSTYYNTQAETHKHTHTHIRTQSEAHQLCCLSPLFSPLSQAQLTHSWPIIDSRTQSSHSHSHSLTQTLSHEWLLTSGKEQIRRKAKALLLLCSGLENISPQLASFASPRLVCSLRPTAVAFLLLFLLLLFSFLEFSIELFS